MGSKPQPKSFVAPVSHIETRKKIEEKIYMLLCGGDDDDADASLMPHMLHI